MAQEFTKVTSEDKKDKGVSGLPDVPNMTAKDLQERFDSLANLAIDAINRLAKELGLDSAASKIGTASGGSLQSWMSSCESCVSRNQKNISSIGDRVTALELSSGTGEGEKSQSFVELKNKVIENAKNISVNEQNISEAQRSIENVEIRLISFSDTSVLSSAWKSDTTYADYPYVAEISLAGINVNYVPYVIFNLDDVQSGMFAPVAQSDTNKIKIYANEQPSKDITIPTIQCIRKA